MKQNWEEQIKHNLGDYNVSPERDLWPDIEQQLDKRDKKRPIVIPLWWKTGAIVATAASLALIFLLSPSQETLDSSVTQIEPNAKFLPAESPISSTTGERTEPEIFSTESPQQSSADESIAQNSSKDQVTRSFKTVPTRPFQSSNESKSVINHSSIPLEKNNTSIAEEPTIEPSDLIKNPEALPKPFSDSSGERNTVALGEQDPTHEPEAPMLIEEEPKAPVSLLADEEVNDVEPKDPKVNDWSIIPVVGPVYYNSLTQGSVFDQSFSDNKREGDVTFSYGLRVNVAIDDRITIRTGINSVAMGYTTQDIEIATGPASFGLNSVTYNDTRNIISVFDKGTLPANPDPANPYSQLNLKSSSGDLSLRANLNYLEFPLELSYALINQGVELSLISGVSGLLLNNNEVSVNDGQNRYVLGSLNNLNQFSFSTNIGLGFNYQVSSSFNIHLEPTFKYQLGAYNDANVVFTPYQLVLLSGLQIQF